MSTNYHIWYSIVFRHEHFNVTEKAIVRILPTKNTSEFGEKRKLIFKTVTNGLHILASDDFVANSANSAPSLDFKVLSLDQHLQNYTDLVPFIDTHVFHIGYNTEGKIDQVVVPIRRSLSSVCREESVSQLRNYAGQEVIAEIESGASNPRFNNYLDQSPEGYYSTDSEALKEIVFEPTLTRNLLAWITINGTKLKNELIEIPLSSREVRLLYRIRSANHNLSTLRVADARGEINFTSEVLENEITFLSDKKIKWLQKNEHSFKIMNGKSKPLKENVSTSTHKNLRFTSENEPYLEIYIHL